ncbi:MAG: DUF5591 domain-containing protein [Euryarchaeota archaeon]|nr:DUF5591 domain-containing protein [Euryarchaeota archaeon]
MKHCNNNQIVLTTPVFYHPDFEDAHRFIIDSYTIPDREICIFLPCAMKKPFSQSPSHRIFDREIFLKLRSEQIHIVVFGTCGVIPRELELMYPFVNYRFMLGKVKDPRIKRDFIEIETERVAKYLIKTKDNYTHRIAFCLGDFRIAMERAVEKTGVKVKILPSDNLIKANLQKDLNFSQGSLHMDVYLSELREYLSKFKK